MRTFYVFRRGKRKNYYVQFVDQVTHTLLPARSTGKTTYPEAIEQAYIMLQTKPQEKKAYRFVDILQSALNSDSLSAGEILKLQSLLNVNSQSMQVVETTNVSVVQKTETPLLQWLRDFWNYEKSDYVQDKLSHGKRISQRYCHDQTLIIRYWEDFFSKDFTVEELTTKHLTDFEKHLYDKETLKKRIVVDVKTGKKHIELYPTKLSTTTRNNIIKCASVPFEWAMRKKLVTENPCKSLTAYSVKAKERGILGRKESAKLFTKGIWKDERARIASLVAMTTGLRLSEILALQEDDIGDDRLFITRSWSPIDGLTVTKNGESRIVPLVPKVKAELLKLCFQNPHREKGDKFIFYGTLAHKPVVSNVITEDFKQALASIGISENLRQKRNIVFHSWRHFYATTIATELSEKHAQLTLGHLTQAMTKHYADHKTEEALLSVCSASNEIFTEMLHA